MMAIRALAQTAAISIIASHGGAGNGLTNTTITVPLNSIYTNLSALSTVSYLYLTGASGVDVSSITCQAYMDAAATLPGGASFSFGKAGSLSTNTVQVGSIICNSTAISGGVGSNLTSTDYQQSSTYVMIVSPPPATATSVGMLAQTPSQYTISTGAMSGSVMYIGPGLPTLTPVGGPHTATSSRGGGYGPSTVDSTTIVTAIMSGPAGEVTAAATTVVNGANTPASAAQTSSGSSAAVGATLASSSASGSPGVQNVNGAVSVGSYSGLEAWVLASLSFLFML